MHWDYWQYQNQPEWFIESVKTMMNQEARNNRKQQTKWQKLQP